MNQTQNIFPFSAIVGNEDFKLALILNIIEPSLGGVLAIGDKGTGKTTLIRSLADLISQEHPFPFVNLPIGASEDRVLGHINLEKLINEKKEHLELGLLGKAHTGCLYIDEINLLNDYLMDLLLDASSSGSYHLEREGISKQVDSRFCLIGSMNPEEGDLRPQLKDRFGLSVNIKTSTSLEDRERIIENRISFDENPVLFLKQYDTRQKKLLGQINTAQQNLKSIEVDKSCYKVAASLALSHQVEGHRADILLIKTARAYAAYLNEVKVNENHIQGIAHLVFNHRSNSTPPDNQNKEQQQEEENKEQEESSNSPQPNSTFKSILPLNERKKTSPTYQSKNGFPTNLKEQHQVSSTPTSVASVDKRKTVGQYLATDKFEFKHKHKESKSQKHLIFLLDSSGSMLKENIVAYAKGLVEKYIESETRFTPLFSLITLYDGEAHLIQSASPDKVALTQKLSEIQTGGKTNIIPAFQKIKTLISTSKNVNNELVLITDGKFNSQNDNALEEVVLAYQTFCKSIQRATVVDAERGVVKLALAKQFASKVKAAYEPLILQHD